MILPIPKRRWLQFSLRMLLAVITLAAIWLGWTMNYLRSLEGQWTAIEQLEAKAESRPDGSGVSYTAEPATVLGSDLPSRLNPKWRLVRSFRAFHEDQSREAAQKIAAFPHLVDLDIADQHLTDYDLETLESLRELKELKVSSPFLTGKFLAGGTLHQTLETLYIKSQEFDQDGVRKIGQCTNLKWLMFQDEHPVGIRQGISDWSFLSNLTKLEALALCGDFPDEALTALAKMPRLRKLTVQSERLTAKGVAEIAKCRSLEELETSLILTEPISVSIQSMKNLKSVLFFGSEIMPTDLEKARPDLKVIFPTFGPGPGSP